MEKRLIYSITICAVLLFIFVCVLKGLFGVADVDYIIKAVTKIDKADKILNKSMFNDHIESADFNLLLKDGQEIYVGDVTCNDNKLTYGHIFTVNDYHLNYCQYDSEKQSFEICSNSGFKELFSLDSNLLPELIDKICFHSRIEAYIPIISADDFSERKILLEEISEIYTEDELKSGEKKYFLWRAN
ncbi:hypothetical protein [Treponema zioleckii]|uniref:hypothetical protein n=1 Tax=Treponema zioleckii TaxID=331680 RepID=UPI00168BC69E|nr:hypothetical protein [Treponema zioleckii]